MSRIGLKPITVPKNVEIESDVLGNVTVKGPKGELKVRIARELTLVQEGGLLTISRPTNQRRHRSQHGLARTLIHNCVVGVTEGHKKTLEIVGVGYRVAAEGQGLNLSLGYSHPVKVAPVDGVAFDVKSDDRSRTQQIVVAGIDKARVGQVAADIRKTRKPDPYKGKGVRYQGEVIKLKPGKRAAGK
ncbi:MAG: 50S ribosomal protein L6 [Fimbriimonadaceae bacterium]|nr:50S ribosomal protein L6 [Fimbriimonadaceae bacterium]